MTSMAEMRKELEAGAERGKARIRERLRNGEISPERAEAKLQVLSDPYTDEEVAEALRVNNEHAVRTAQAEAYETFIEREAKWWEEFDRHHYDVIANVGMILARTMAATELAQEARGKKPDLGAFAQTMFDNGMLTRASVDEQKKLIRDQRAEMGRRNLRRVN